MRGENKWLLCPFCGKDLKVFDREIRNGKVVEVRIHPLSRSCVLGYGGVFDRLRWNRRANKKGT